MIEYDDWFNIAHSTVRDLVWVMDSPSLLVESPTVVADELGQHLVSQYRAWYQQLDLNPAPLSNWLGQQSNPRLGYYFEQLVGYWLKHCVGRNYFDSHVRVYKGKQTLGEFDFLFMSNASTLMHWETAVKFYLGYRDDSEQVRWYGPNAQDRLDLKLARLNDHQLCLANTPQGNELINKLQNILGFSDFKSQAFIKGYLFYPLQHDWRTIQLTPFEVSARHLRGWWERFDKFIYQNVVDSYANMRWVILPRSQWLAPTLVNRDPENLVLHFDELQLRLQDHFNHQRSALMVVQLENVGNSWRECSRGFIVTTSWPETGCSEQFL